MKHRAKLVEKSNPLDVHGYFISRETAEKFLRDTVPDYCRRGYYMDKSLVPESFAIVDAEGVAP